MSKPTVRSAPGLRWVPRANGRYVARWQCRTDILAKGYTIKSVKLGTFIGDPTEEDWNFLVDTCVSLQQEMLVWSRGGEAVTLANAEEPIPFDGTLAGLMACYKTDPDSNFRKLRYHSRKYYETLMGLIEREHGTEILGDAERMKGRTFLRWHAAWGADGKAAAAHGKIGMLRTLFGFGATILEDPHCIRLKTILSGQRFEMPKARTGRLTVDHALAIRKEARAKGKASIAMAQAFQFELMLRQKDVIGEYVPMGEPGMSDVLYVDVERGRHDKWLRGIRWEEIDQNLILSHVTSKRQKLITVDLKNAPMVLEELALLTGNPDKLTRDLLPAKGPIVVDERDNLPWDAVEFRRWWRILASSSGVPDDVRNMDSRAGAITEASDAGALLEHIRDAATHSDIGMTQRYSRNAVERTATVQKLRNATRNKTET